MKQAFRFVARYKLILVLVIVTFVAGWLVGLLRGSFIIDLGGDDRLDQLYIQPAEDGFFAPEKRPTTANTSADITYRWVSRDSVIRLPWTLDSVPLKATLLATAPRPDRSPDKTGTVMVVSGNGTELGRFELNGLYDGSELVLNLPPHLRPTLEPFRLNFAASETYQPGKGDIRNLAAIFLNLKLEPDYANFGVKGWAASFIRPVLLAIMVWCWWGLAGFFTRREGWRLAMGGVGAGLLLGSMLWWRQAAEPFYLAWAIILLVGWLLLWLAGKFAEAAPGLPAPFVYAATLLPGMPLAQGVFGRLSFADWNNGAVSLVLYFAALGLATIVYLLERPRFETVFMWAFLAVAVIIFAYSHYRVFEQNLYRAADFRNYYIALLDAQEGKRALYSLQEMAASPGLAVRSAPAFAIFFWPLTIIFGRDINGAVAAWRIANELLLIPVLYIFLQIFGAKFIPQRAGLKMWPAILFLTLSFGQLADTTAYGQQNYLLLFGLALTGLWISCRKDGLAGVALSVPIWVKLLPAVTGAFFLIEKRWKGLVGLIIGAVVINLLTIPVIGWNDFWFYFTKGMWSVNEPELGITNQSWWGAMGRLGVVEIKGDFVGGYPTGLAPLGYLVALLGISLTLLAMWRARGKGLLTEQLMLGALALVALWVPPFSWMHYIVPGLVAVMAMLVALSAENTSRTRLVIFGLCYVLLAYGGRMEFFFTEAVGLARLGSSYRFMATFGLWALNLWLLWKTTPSQAKTSPIAPALVTSPRK